MKCHLHTRYFLCKTICPSSSLNRQMTLLVKSEDQARRLKKKKEEESSSSSSQLLEPLQYSEGSRVLPERNPKIQKQQSS